MTTDTPSILKRIGTIAGWVLTLASAAGGAWFGLQEAGQWFNSPEVSSKKPPAPGRQVPHGSSISAGEVVLATSKYAAPPEVVDPTSATPTPTSSVKATQAASAKPDDVKPAGWTASSTDLKLLWEINASADWAVSPTPLSPPNWRVVGVVQRGNQSQAIVQVDNDPTPRFFKLGDTLPGGAKLTSVAPDLIKVTIPQSEQASSAINLPVLAGALESSSKTTTATTLRP